LVGDRVALLSYHAFGEVEVVHEHQCVVLPAALNGMDFPGEALGCAMNIYKRADIHRGQFVAVIGTGFLGTLLVQMAASAFDLLESREGSFIKALITYD
jgi:threonine dehydrogenase-like Zn-dependent dehydrogenase